MFIGCLLAIAIGLMPRFALILAWLFSARWDLVWDSWFWPLLGILFLPYTTVMYMLAWTVGTGVVGWDWMWVVMGLVLDLIKWTQLYTTRRQVPGYPVSAP